MHYNSLKSRYLRVMLLSLVFLLTAGQAIAGGSGIYLRGDMNGWGAPANWEFQTTQTPNLYVLTGVNLKNGQTCKVASAPNGGWDDNCNYGSNDKIKLNSTCSLFLNSSSNHNIKVEGDLNNVKLTLDLNNKTLTVSEAEYFLKHPWGDGENESWSWKQLTANGNGTYSVDAQYGGTGCNWNTTEAEEGKRWIENPTLVNNPSVGDECTFTLNPTEGTDGTITITKNAPGNTYTIYYKGNYRNAYIWIDISQEWKKAWPGEAMTQDDGDWYKIVLKDEDKEKGYNRIIFNNNDNEKTGNLTIPESLWETGEARYDTDHWVTGELYIKFGDDGTYTLMSKDTDGNFTWTGDINNKQVIKFSNNGTDAAEYHLASSGSNTNFWIQENCLEDPNPNFGAGNDYEMKYGNGNYTVTVPADYSSVSFTKNVAPFSISEVYIFGGLDINVWDDGNEKGRKMTDTGNGVFTYEFTYNAAGNKYWAFKAKNSEDAYKFLRNNETTAIALGGTVAYAEYDERNNISYYCDGIENGGKYLITLDTNNKTVTIKRTGGHSANEIPVYPLGVQSETELEAYDFAGNPVVYLLAEVLNHELISPEWQMTKGADGKYHLDGFAMRTTKCHTHKGDETEEKTVFVRKFTAIDSHEDVGGTTVDLGNVHLSEGKLYNAVFDAQRNVLTLTEDESANGRMPFISLVGNEMKQDQNYDTPRGSKSDYGWQEAWLQYDENGKLLKDRRGNVMYSTMWPPKYPIYFTANIGGERLYSSEQMAFKAQNNYVAKTGAEWKAELMASENGEAYNNLGTGDYELEDDVEYVRYVVPDIWYVGAAKIWTGWTGRQNDHGDAQWSNHRNWGYGDKELGSGDAGTPVEAEMPYYLSTEKDHNGNFYFEKPTYFKTIEFFYNTSDYNKSRLYTTLAFGNAQIEAQSHKEGDAYDRGMYKPTVTPGEGVTIQSYIIRCYDAATNELVTLNNGIVAQDNQGNSPSSLTFVNDALGLAEGKYYYEMEVVFNIEGTEKQRTTTVRSNPFTIYFPGVYTTETQSYQLLKLESAMNGYNYLTVAQDTEKGAIYAANLNADGQVTEVVAITSEQRAAAVAQYDDRDNLYTDRVLVLAPVPAQFKLDAEKSSATMEIENYSLNETANEFVIVTPQTDGSMAYVFQQGHMGNVNHKAVMNYTTTVEGSTTTKHTMGKEVSTYMVRPNPVAGALTVNVEKVENGTTLEGKEVSYYKVNANKSFMDPNTENVDENVDVDYSIAGNDNTYRMTGARGERGIAITNLDPAATSQATVVVKYRDAQNNYTLDANKFAPVEITSSEVAIKEGERSISGAEITYDKNYSRKWGKLVSAITAFEITETTPEKFGERGLDVELYEPKVYVDGGETAYGFYTMNKANVTTAEKTYFTATELGEMNTGPNTPEAIKYYFDNGKTGNADLIEVKIAIAPVYPILVDPAVSLTGFDAPHAAPALKADDPSKITTLNGKAAEYIINPNDIITGINDIVSKAVQSVHFVNVAGQMSDKPFEGVNIVVTKYTDGSTQAVKMVK